MNLCRIVLLSGVASTAAAQDHAPRSTVRSPTVTFQYTAEPFHSQKL